MTSALTWAVLFLSTPSARRATLRITVHCALKHYFYPRPPRGGRLFPECTMQKLTEYFYPRPPRGGRRLTIKDAVLIIKFLSTPSARRATPATTKATGDIGFLSTPSARRATPATTKATGDIGFLSTPSARRATCCFYSHFALSLFLSTPSARRATKSSTSWTA